MVQLRRELEIRSPLDNFTAGTSQSVGGDRAYIICSTENDYGKSKRWKGLTMLLAVKSRNQVCAEQIQRAKGINATVDR